MKKSAGVVLVLAVVACGGGPDTAQDTTRDSAAGFPAAVQLPENAVTVALVPQVPEPGSERGLRWSPYGKQLPLAATPNGMETRLHLGPEGTPPIALLLRKSRGAAHFDELLVDGDRDGRFSPSETLSTTPTERNHKFWSSFDAVVEVPVVDPATGRGDSDPYPLSLWYVEDPRVPQDDPVLRFSRRGYLEGQATLGGVEAGVLVTENVMDGVFRPDDAWALASRDSAADLLKPGYSRDMTEHLWLYETAYNVVSVDPSGRRIVLAPFDPGMTRAEEEEMNDHLRVDREAARSGRTVAFLRDFEAAEREARDRGLPLFVDFETDWCGPCKIMDEWVYTADAVVDAAGGVVAVKVDGDERLDLKEKFQVTGFPTMILLNAEGVELARASGYVNVADMTEFLEG